MHIYSGDALFEQALRHTTLQDTPQGFKRCFAQCIDGGDLPQHFTALKILLQHQTGKLLVVLVVVKAFPGQCMQRLQRL